MSFNLINKELKIFSCGISDLTLKQTKQFLESWNDNSTIGSLTLFYDEDGNIILNADNKNFEMCKDLVLEYLVLKDEEKERVKKFEDKFLSQTFKVLDNALICRRDLETQKKWLSLKNILGKQYIPSETELDIIDLIYSKERDKYMAKIDIYNYAFIQGKRAERAKRKKSNSTIEHKNI